MHSINKIQQERYNNTHITIEEELYKQCSICLEWFPCTEEYFHRNKSNNSDGLHPYCRSCNSKKSSQWQKDNPEKYKERYEEFNKKVNEDEELRKRRREISMRWLTNGKYLEYQRTHKDKFKEYGEKRTKKNHKISSKEWESCKQYFNNSCAYCGLSIEEHYNKYKGEIILTDLHKEHFDDTGANDISNCIPSCKTCNCKKNVFSFNEWYTKDNPVFDIERLNKIIKWINEDYKLYIKENKPKRKYTRKI